MILKFSYKFHDIFGGEPYFSPRGDSTRVLKLCMWSSVTKKVRLHP
jgi:hypothetical protein